MSLTGMPTLQIKAFKRELCGGARQGKNQILFSLVSQAIATHITTRHLKEIINNVII